MGAACGRRDLVNSGIACGRWLQFFLVACWGMACLPLAGAELSSTTLRAIFGEGDHKGCLVGLQARDGRDFASHRQQAPLWSVEGCRAGSFDRRFVVRADEAKAFSCRREGDRLVLTWTDAGDVVEKAVATIVAKEGDPALRCRLSVTPKPGFALVETRFPNFLMSECLGAEAADDAVVLGKGQGGLMRDPMNPRREYWNLRQLAHSPGTLVAQFGCFYDDRGGLYTQAEDADGNEKELLMDRHWRRERADGSFCGGEFTCCWSRFEYSETTDDQPYDILLQAFENPDGEETTWYDAADIYKRWAKNQFWCRKTFLEKSDFLPDWTREAPIVMGFGRSWLDNPDKLKRWLDGYWRKKFSGAPLVAILEGWEHHGDWITTEYFPMHPSEEKFAEMMGWVKAAGGHFWPWPGGHHWNVTVGKRSDGTFRLDFTKDFAARAEPHAIVGRDGKVDYRSLGWLAGGKTATMCPGDSWTVDWWNREVACELVKRGADLVQADQDVGARLPTCWSTSHGHKPGPGRWAMRAQRHQFETMIAEMRKINPSAMFSFEENHEFFNDLYAFADYRTCRWPGPEWASVFNYLYHEYVPPFQSGAEQYDRWTWLAFCAADGQMPRLPVQEDFYGLDDAFFPNGDFESLDAGGKGFLQWENLADHEVVSTDVPQGRYALRVHAPTKFAQIARSVPVDSFWEPGRAYRVSAWLKAERDEPRNSFHVTALKREKGQYRRFGGTALPIPKAADGWKRVSGTFKIAPGASSVRFMMDAYEGTGFLVDDARFEEQKPDGTFGPIERKAGERGKALAFIEDWIRLYRGEGRKYLAHGRELHPPKVECERFRNQENFRGSEIDNVKPAVFATAWEAADGSRALVFANATAYEQPVAYRWNGKWRQLTMSPHGLRLIQVDK